MKRRKAISAGSLISLGLIPGCSQLNSSTEEENSIREQTLTKGSGLSIDGISISANDFLVKNDISNDEQNKTYTPPADRLYFLTLMQFKNNSESEYELPSASEFVLEYNNQEMPLADISEYFEIKRVKYGENIESNGFSPGQSYSTWIIHTIPIDYELNLLELSFLFERGDRTIRVLWNPDEDAIESPREGSQRIIQHDSITDLLPDVEDFPDGDWEVDYITENPDSDLHTDIEARYESESDEKTKIAIISVASYNNIEDAEERYDSSFSRAESQNRIEKSLNESVDEGYLSEADGFNVRVWRDMNIVFKVSTNQESQYDLPDISEDLRVIVQDNWQEQFR